MNLDQLADQHQVPRPTLDGEVLRLSRAAASNAVVFRQARAEAEQRGLKFEVEPLTEVPFASNGSASNSDSGDGSGGES